LNGTVDLRSEFYRTAELLNFLALSASLISDRSPQLWRVDDRAPPSMTLPLTPLKLGFGTLAVNLKNFSENHLQILPGSRVQLRDNSHENLVTLAWTALGLSQNLNSLSHPNTVERTVLNASQIQDLIGPGGAKEKLFSLFTASVVEALARRRNSAYEIETLFTFLRRAGDALDNDYLRNLPRKPDPLQ